MIVTLIGILTVVLPVLLAVASWRQYRRYRNRFFRRTATAFSLVFVGYVGPVLFSASLGLRATVLVWSILLLVSFSLLAHAFLRYEPVKAKVDPYS